MRTAPRVTLGTPEMVDVVYQGKLIPWVWVENEEVINYALDEQQPPRQEGKGNWKAIKDVFPTERGTYTILVAVPDADPMDSNNQTQWIPVYYGSAGGWGVGGTSAVVHVWGHARQCRYQSYVPILCAAGEQGIQGRMASYIHMPTSTFLTKDKFKYHSFRALQERGFSIRIRFAVVVKQRICKKLWRLLGLCTVLLSCSHCRYRAVYLEQVANLIQTLEESYVIPNLNFPLNDKRSSGHHRLPHIPYRTKPGVREWELRGLGDFELKFNNLHEIAEPPTKPAGFDDNVSRKSEHRKYMEA